MNGFSTSLPEKTQMDALRKIEGLENVKMFRAGYAIEYDYFPPTQLKLTLETKLVDNLFFSGQINGTTGYEEAAAQGIIAGINAHLKVKKRAPFILDRSEAYIGVLIDDLITKGTEEPYRMFTSRAEFRLLLRQDNADIRLTEKSFNIGLASKERIDNLTVKKNQTNETLKFLETKSIDLSATNMMLKQKKSSLLKQKVKYKSVLLRPEINMKDLLTLNSMKDFIKEKKISNDALEQAELTVKYGGYLDREKQTAEKMKRLENIKIPTNFEFEKLHSISTEGRQKLKEIGPLTIGQASRISGVSPSDINVLLIYLGR